MARQISDIIDRARSLSVLPKRGRELVERIPAPVRLSLAREHRRWMIILLEVAGGALIMASVLLLIAYARLAQGPVSLGFLVPKIEESINRELADVRVKIDDFVARSAERGTGIDFRLSNVRLIDNNGLVIAQAPAAGIGLSGKALLSGRIAPGSVDFIGPRLLLFFTPEKGLSLTFSRETARPAGPADLRGSQDPEPPKSGGGIVTPGKRLEPGIALIAPSRQIDLTRTITSAFESARRRETASSFLTRFGVRDAIVVFDQGDKRSFWQVPDFSIDLEHKQKRSIILGEANISSKAGPWKFSFRTEQSQKQKSLTFTALIKDLVPTGLAANFPEFPALRAFNLPLNAKTSLKLSTSGDLVEAEAKLDVSAGQIVMPWDKKYPISIDSGNVHVRYQATDDRIEVLPSTISWGDSKATISGEFIPTKDAQGVIQDWKFHLQANDSILAAEEFGLTPVKVDRWEARGVYMPKTGRIDLAHLIIAIGENSLELAGSVIDAPGSPAVKMQGRMSPMSMATLKRIWPKFVAAGAKEWVGGRVTDGELLGGRVQIDIPGGMIADIPRGGDVPDSAFRLEAAARGLEIHYIDGLPPVRTGDALIRMAGRRFAMDVPSGDVVLPSGKKIALSAGKFTVDDLRPLPEIGVIDFQMKGEAEAVLELLDLKPLEYVKAIGFSPGDIGGQAEGSFKVQLPLVKGLEFSDVKLRGTAEVNEARLNKAFGDIGVEGGAVVFNVTEQALEARGDILLNGVPALLTWQRIFQAPVEKQPDLRLTTLLDENSRTQLGLDVNHIIRGTAPLIMSVRHGQGGKPKYRVRADLSNTDVVLANMGWRKPQGKSAILTFDVGEGANGNTELQNFRIEGNELGIEGWISLGDDNKPVAFYFPDFSFNVITRMEIAGELRNDGIWDVQAHGSAYDGRQLFQSLFSAGQLVEDQESGPADLGGVNLTARMGAVAGYFNTVINDVSITMQKRDGKLTALDVSGKFEGESQIGAKLISEPGKPRVLVAESEDAGASFRLVGFYPRIEGGEASLQVNLDGEGSASTTGVLWAQNFSILGDRVVSEVLASAGEDPSLNWGERPSGEAKPQRQKIPFDQLRAPFSVGKGQFLLHDAYINGPQLGATMRGNVDFNTRQVEVGGTYIPVYGLNSALGSIPIIGSLLVGRRGEGVLGITFAIKGPMSDPDVKVNPVSMVAPGILRQIFEYTGRSPQNFSFDTAPKQEEKPAPDASATRPDDARP